MFNPFSRPRVPGFNVRPEDVAPGFRVTPPPEAIGFNIDENGMPGSDHPGQLPAPYPLGFPQGLDQPIPGWLHRLLSMPLPDPSAPLSVRWSVPDGLLVNSAVSDPAADPAGEPDASAGPSGPEATGSALPWPPDNDETELQAETGENVPSTADPNFVLANADGDSVQEAQQTLPPGRVTPPPVRPVPPAQAKPGANRPLRREMSGEEITRLAESRREQALSQDPLFEASRYAPAREERRHYWDHIIRALPIPNRLSTLRTQGLPEIRAQRPLSADWRADVRKINPSYLDHTEAAARKYGIPPELLARLLYRESDYANKGVDSNGNPIPRRAVGIPQMYPDALRDVGVDPGTFGRAGAAAQIDAGAAYLAQQYRRFGDWPRAVAAYHFGYPRIEAWLAGKGPTYENITQRKNDESWKFRGQTVQDREQEAEKTAKDQMNQWAELQAYLPYIFLGDPTRYDRPGSP